ncbi:MAG: S26 family signal peptidase [Halanaeroarchaeum sp.]
MADEPADRDESTGSDDPDAVDSTAGDARERFDRMGKEDSRGPSASVQSSSQPEGGAMAAIRRFWHSKDGWVVFVREILTSVLAVLFVGLLLFAVSGVWPPMVAVESGSMEPHMERGDLVFVMDEERLAPPYATDDTGVVTYAAGQENEYRSFGSYGDVIIYHPNGDPARKPVIHRAHFWVEEGENWLPRADPAYVSGEDCESVPNCPAPHAGFITKGDNELTNDYYDQTRGISEPVKPEWIQGSAEVKIPWLGWVRLTFSETISGPQTLAWEVGSENSVRIYSA